MTDIRAFIRNMGDDAASFFDVEPKTIQRWIKTGNLPIAKANKLYVAMSAMEKAQQPVPPPQTSPEAPVVAQDPVIDPLTHLPVNLEKRVPQQQAGRPPDWIDNDPTEQSFGMNMTRPGRLAPTTPMRPMKLRDEGGQKVAYVDEPKAPTVLPPTISNAGWADQGRPLPAPLTKPNPNDPRPAQRTPEGVPQN